ncbi:hypothetical protein [Streptomyces sp. PSAA01]|uniref:hypothetical protein n=1 Tax=Streptomyces sp. PSAA01 TaxID=2912762 RepID=UPI001F33B120|nr:hypothetical protein [Streptomyces sp. PSAA01]MCG0289396.1 hypothetical protein [Streptomyces sp. PSAA01]
MSRSGTAPRRCWFRYAAIGANTGKRKGQNPSVAGIYRALAEHEKGQAYPEAIEAARAELAALQNADVPRPRPDTEILLAL